MHLSAQLIVFVCSNPVITLKVTCKHALSARFYDLCCKCVCVVCVCVCVCVQNLFCEFSVNDELAAGSILWVVMVGVNAAEHG